MSLEISSLLNAGRDSYATLRKQSYARRARFASLTGGRKPMNFKPIGLSAAARNRATAIRNGGTALLQGLLDLTTASQDAQVDNVYKTAVQKAVEEYQAAQENFAESGKPSSTIFDESA